MKRNILLFALSLTLLFAAPRSWALEELMRNYRGSRSLGMGGVVFSTGVYDESLFANPATQLMAPDWRISILNLTAEANDNMISSFNDVMDIVKESGSGVLSKIGEKNLAGENEHYRVSLLPGFYSPRLFGENTSFAFGILVNNQTNLMLRSQAEVEMQALMDAGPALGVAHRFSDLGLSVGINARVIYRLAADRTLRTNDFTSGSTRLSLKSLGTQGAGIDGDIGAFYVLPLTMPFFLKQVGIAASLNNVAASSYQQFGKEVLSSVNGGRPPRNDRTFNTGLRFDFPDVLFLYDSLWAFEIQNAGTTGKMASFYKKVHMGGETRLFTRRFSVRGGVNQGYFSGGVGFELPLFKINVATYGEELGSNAGQLEDRRVALNVEIAI